MLRGTPEIIWILQSDISYHTTHTEQNHTAKHYKATKVSMLIIQNEATKLNIAMGPSEYYSFTPEKA